MCVCVCVCVYACVGMWCVGVGVCAVSAQSAELASCGLLILRVERGKLAECNGKMPSVTSMNNRPPVAPRRQRRLRLYAPCAISVFFNCKSWPDSV